MRGDIQQKNIELQQKDWRFSITHFTKLADSRNKLIYLRLYLKYLSDKHSNIGVLLHEAMLVLESPELTDKEMYAKINEKFDLADKKLSLKIIRLHKKIKKILQELIKDEQKYGRFIKAEDLKMTASSEETKKHSKVERKEKLKEKLEERGSSSKSFEEESVSQEKISKAPSEKRNLSEAESSSDRIKEPLIQPMDVSVPMPVSVPASAGAPLVPVFSSSLLILNTLDDTPRTESSVHSELEGLRTARSVSQGKRAYMEAVLKKGGSLTLQQDALISPRFFIRGQSSKGSQTARAEPSASNEAALTEVGGGR